MGLERRIAPHLRRRVLQTSCADAMYWPFDLNSPPCSFYADASASLSGDLSDLERLERKFLELHETRQ